MNFSPKGILFDFDGTLADTMEDHYLAWKVALAEHGVSIKKSDYYPMEGMGLHEIARKFVQNGQWSFAQFDQLVAKKKKYYVKHSRLEFYFGVQPLIFELHQKKIPMGIVTAGHIDQLLQSVPSSFLDSFDVLVTGDQLTKEKPDPEPYLKGMEKLGLQCHECIAVENAPLGVQSAKKAKLYCIAICSTVTRAQLGGADAIIESFEELRNLKSFQKLLTEEDHAFKS